ncbi:hypothetical protein, partial [Halomonas sp. AOP42-E1-30]|uniref:hypothetical protein n=1 Tax=Halomonas sp. AOP42-E1-30 TaxID=3457665 RepID=UPI004034D887
MQFFRTFVFCLLFIVCIPSFSYASFPRSQQAGADIANTYGFLLGQSIALEHVETHYPDMAGQIIVAEASFNAAFPLIQERLREIMIDFNGVDHLERVEAEGVAMLKSNLERQPMTRELAETTVQTIRNRAEGVMESPAREILLATHYMDKPAEEVRDDFYQPFESEGHP